MPTYTDEGIVLRRINYGEADRILTVMTRDSGKIGVIARGVRKPRAKVAAQTDLFVRSTMQLASGRGQLHVLTQAAAIPPMVSCSDPLRLACAGTCAELVDKALEGEHPDASVYELLTASLADTFSSDREPRAVLTWFVQRLLDRLGYAPQLVNCASCHGQLSAQPATFVARSGGLVCNNCSRGGAEAIRCSVNTIKVLRVIAASDQDTFSRLRWDVAILSELLTVIEAEVAEHVGKRIRSLEMVGSLAPRN